MHAALHKPLALLAGVALSLSLCATISPASAASEAGAAVSEKVQVQKNRPCMTRNEYVRLKRGMTLGRVKNIVGTKGTIQYGDIHRHTRQYWSCETVDQEHMSLCMSYKRKQRADGSFRVARLVQKNAEC